MTTKHPFKKTGENEYTYRDYKVTRRPTASIHERYRVPKGWSYVSAPTQAAMMDIIDEMAAFDEKQWTPVLRADGTYCSPGCGARCTKDAHDEARRNAALLVSAMGPGWKPRVWENLGWHFEARLDSSEVECHVMPPNRNRDRYTCFLNTNPQFVVMAGTPNEAVAEALRMLSNHVDNLNRAARVVRNPSA